MHGILIYIHRPIVLTDAARAIFPVLYHIKIVIYLKRSEATSSSWQDNNNLLNYCFGDAAFTIDNICMIHTMMADEGLELIYSGNKNNSVAGYFALLCLKLRVSHGNRTKSQHENPSGQIPSLLSQKFLEAGIPILRDYVPQRTWSR